MTIKEICENLPCIETERLILRKMTFADKEDYEKCIGDARIYKYWGKEMTEKEANAESQIAHSLGELGRHHELIWGIALKTENRIFGEISAMNFEGTYSQHDAIAEIGYRMSSQMWHEGIMTEAVGAIVKFMFENTAVIRLQGFVMKDNIGSRKVLEKNGFQLEGLVRQGKFLDVICDHYMLSIIRDDYENMKKKQIC